MARVYSDVNVNLGPSWYDYGEFKNPLAVLRRQLISTTFVVPFLR